jgi:hypothetical protein
MVGQNIIPMVVTAQDGKSQQTYTVTVTRSPSANANLLQLITSSGVLTPGFSNTTIAYTRNVPYTTTSITFTATTVDATATITINGSPMTSGTASAAQSLKTGDNVFTIVVTAGDKTTTKTFTVTVTRA